MKIYNSAEFHRTKLGRGSTKRKSPSHLMQRRPKQPKLTTMFQTQKKASQVEEESKTVTSQSQAVREGLGLLGDLPHQALYSILGHAALSVLTNLCSTSRMCSELVLSYIESGEGQTKFKEDIKRPIAGELYCATCHITHYAVNARLTFKDWGQLLKAVSCLYATRIRIKMMAEFYDMHVPVDRVLPPNEIKGWGELFMTVIECWDFLECEKVFVEIMNFDQNKAADMVKAFLDRPQGEDLELEHRLRQFLRSIFLDHQFADDSNYPFWLNMLLRGRSTIEQAKLLALLYAPATNLDNNNNNNQDEHMHLVLWNSLIDIAVSSTVDADIRIRPIARALHSLAIKSPPGYSWSTTQIFALIEDISTFPEPWSLDNFCMLFLYSPSLANVTLSCRIANGYAQEAGLIFNTMAGLCARLYFNTDKCLKAPFKHLTLTMKKDRMQRFVTKIYKAHVEAVDHLYDQLGLHPLAQSNLEREYKSFEAVQRILNDFQEFC